MYEAYAKYIFKFKDLTILTYNKILFKARTVVSAFCLTFVSYFSNFIIYVERSLLVSTSNYYYFLKANLLIMKTEWKRTKLECKKDFVIIYIFILNM